MIIDNVLIMAALACVYIGLNIRGSSKKEI